MRANRRQLPIATDQPFRHEKLPGRAPASLSATRVRRFLLVIHIHPLYGALQMSSGISQGRIHSPVVCDACGSNHQRLCLRATPARCGVSGSVNWGDYLWKLGTTSSRLDFSALDWMLIGRSFQDFGTGWLSSPRWSPENSRALAWVWSGGNGSIRGSARLQLRTDFEKHLE